MGQKERDASATPRAMSWPAPNPRLKPDPKSWAWIERMPPPYVEPKGKKL
jgi:hypothetical protein